MTGRPEGKRRFRPTPSEEARYPRRTLSRRLFLAGLGALLGAGTVAVAAAQPPGERIPPPGVPRQPPADADVEEGPDAGPPRQDEWPTPPPPTGGVPPPPE